MILEEELNEMLKSVVEELGYSYQERIYQYAMAILLKKKGYDVKLEVVHDVLFMDECIGQSRSDLEINGKVILEFKTTSISSKNVFQVKRYKNITGIEEAYIVFVCDGNYGVLRIR
jgi:GxxExxY protein